MSAAEGTLDTLHDLAKEIEASPWGTDEHNDAVSQYYDALRTIGIEPGALGELSLTEDNYREEIPLFQTSLIRSAGGSDFFTEILELLKSLLKDFGVK